jgi:hypothetical protein
MSLIGSEHDESRDWREFDDREARQDRIADDLAGALSDEPGF